MSYSTNPVADAARYYDAADYYDAAFEAALAAETASIVELFTTVLRQIGVAYIPSPCAPNGAVKRVSLAGELHDLITEPGPWEALIAVIDGSDCPKVCALREAMGKRWAYHHAADVVRARGAA